MGFEESLKRRPRKREEHRYEYPSERVSRPPSRPPAPPQALFSALWGPLRGAYAQQLRSLLKPENNSYLFSLVALILEHLQCILDTRD
jgi:hypothetical protein